MFLVVTVLTNILIFGVVVIVLITSNSKTAQILKPEQESENSSITIKASSSTRRSTKWEPLASNPNETTLIFIHIPKTAGSTFKQSIDFYSSTQFQWFPRRAKKSWNAPGCRKNYSKHYIAKKQHHIYGPTHCGFSEMKSCFSKKMALIDYGHAKTVKYVSIIRDPVERVISEYFWWRKLITNKNNKRPPKAWPENLREVSGNLTEWLLHKDNTAHNRQFKSLVEFQDLFNPFGRDDCVNVDGNRNLKIWKGVNLDEYKNRLLDTIGNEFLFVGILEEYDKSLEVFSKITGMQVEKKINRRNLHGSEKKTVSDELKKIILDKNQLDLFLYNHVLTKLKS